MIFRCLRFAGLLILLSGSFWAPALHAQSPTPLARANLPLYRPGYVSTMATMSNGDVIIGGQFSSIDGVARTSLAKLKPDGSLDTAWAPQVSSGGNYNVVYAVIVDGSDNVYMAGTFTEVNGEARQGLAKFLADGSLDPNWNPAITGTPQALALDGAGSVFVGGAFSAVNVQAISNLAKLSATGGGDPDTSWLPSPDGMVNALAADGAGHLFVGGAFANIGGQARNDLAKLNASSGLADANWNPAASLTSNDSVKVLLLDGAGNLYVGGQFAAIGGQTRNSIAKLATAGTGAADASWNPAPTGSYVSVESLAIDGSNLYIGGYFDGIGGQTIAHVARVATSGSGAVDASWHPGPDFYVYSVTVSGTSVMLGGTFTGVGGIQHLGFAMVNGSAVVVASTPDMEMPAQVLSIAFAADGSAIVGGGFYKAGQTPRKNLLRLHADGTLDTTWDVPADQFVSAVAIAPSGDIFAAGAFSNIGGVAQKYVARISAAGVVDAAWNPVFDSNVLSLAVDASAVYVGGQFTSVDSTARLGLVKLAQTGSGDVDANWDPLGSNQDYVYALALDGSGNLYSGGYLFLLKMSTAGAGAVDSSWNPGAPGDGPVRALALDGAGSLFVGGGFTSIGGNTRNHLAKISATGSGAVDAAWAPTSDQRVYALATDGNDHVYIGGYFANVDGQARSYVARLSASGPGALDATWNPQADNVVRALRVHDGLLYASGDFAHIGTQARGGLATFALDVIFSNGFD